MIFVPLKGIVFGIRPPIEVNAEIIKIIHAKCKETGWKDFLSYQAHFDKKEHMVMYDELGLLNLKPFAWARISPRAKRAIFKHYFEKSNKLD